MSPAAPGDEAVERGVHRVDQLAHHVPPFSPLARQQHASQDPPLAPRFGRVRQPRLEHAGDVAEQVSELRVVEPHPGQVVADAVAQRIDVSPGQVTVEVAQQAGHERDERLPVVVDGHRLELAHADVRRREAKDVRALDRTAHAALGHHAEHAGVDQPSDVAIQACRRHVRELGAELGGRQRPVTEERLDDPQSDRVQKKVGGGHQGVTLRPPLPPGRLAGRPLARARSR